MRLMLDLRLSSLGSLAVTESKMCKDHKVTTLLMAHTRCRPIGWILDEEFEKFKPVKRKRR